MSTQFFKYGLIALSILWTSACASTSPGSAPPSDEYVTWMRVIGLYPVTRIPVALGYKRWQTEYRNDVEGWTGAHVEAWQPEIPTSAPSAVLANAPVLLIEQRQPADLIGTPVPREGRVHVDTSRPLVTWRLGTTAFRGQTLSQISYAVWFPQRPKSHAFDLTGGSLDILVLRVTLGRDGRPVLYDTVHGCGCYHMFFPVPPTRRKPMPEDKDLREAAFVPFDAPVLNPGERLGVRITAGTHYIVGLEATGPDQGQTYALADAQTIEEHIAPLYNTHGILPQSRRLERFVLWPMGIRSAGAMRAPGRRPTAFVGKRHFDDADLLDRAFE